MQNRNLIGKVDDVIKCPICHQNVVSDASFKDSCALCGMNLQPGKNWPTLSNDKSEMKFCCEECLRKYKMFHD